MIINGKVILNNSIIYKNTFYNSLFYFIEYIENNFNDFNKIKIEFFTDILDEKSKFILKINNNLLQFYDLKNNTLIGGIFSFISYCNLLDTKFDYLFTIKYENLEKLLLNKNLQSNDKLKNVNETININENNSTKIKCEHVNTDSLKNPVEKETVNEKEDTNNDENIEQLISNTFKKLRESVDIDKKKLKIIKNEKKKIIKKKKKKLKILLKKRKKN